ncbi:MAG TPA: AraC family transcriptional regulator [Candidatus Scatomorpha pullicola]|nr:AraC family transcriptional regulator [Candidatus Scatomorpha pullicola]
MDWIDRLNEAVRYIEDNLTGEIEYEKLGQIACCSAYHFQRMFNYIAGVPLSEYIRRRKMSLAAVDIQGGEAKIIDVAAKYGYASPTAFNRAFQSVHGVSPSAVRSEGVAIKSFPPITIKVTVKGVEEMNYRIETRKAFRIVGKSFPLSREIERNFAEVPQMWQGAVEDGTIEKIVSLMNGEPRGVLGVSVCTDGEEWRYYIAVSSAAEIDDALEEYVVPGCTWAVFPGSGTGKSIQELEGRIVTEWLPTSGYEFTNGSDIEVYFEPNPENTAYEVWIPVRKRQE